MPKKVRKFISGCMQSTFDGSQRQTFFFTDLYEGIVVKIEIPEDPSMRQRKSVDSRVNRFISFSFDEMVQW